jgi:hypothetical protein
MIRPSRFGDLQRLAQHRANGLREMRHRESPVER